MALDVPKRLLGKEDINFDSTGENATANFTNADGVEKTLHKFNAAHIPLTTGLRAKLNNAANVEAGLEDLKNTLDNFSDVQVMTQNTVIEFGAAESLTDIQVRINQQIKDFGGHVLNFTFPAAINQQLVNALSFKGFKNGTLVISGNFVTIADNADIGELFSFIDCTCKVEIINVTLQHTQSAYAIKAERCTEIYCDTVTFSGMGTSFAIQTICSGRLFNNCTFTNDSESDDYGLGGGADLDSILAYS